jgi:hypothetical protein
MSTTPPEQPTTQQQPGYSRPDLSNVTAMMPMPGNAELIVYVLATILVAIIALSADAVNAGEFVTAFTVMTLAYLLSRGIAKASRVLER